MVIESEIEVYVPVIKAIDIDSMFGWCKNNKIPCRKVESIRKSNLYGRAKLEGFNFIFYNEEDAMAFKLKWL